MKLRFPYFNDSDIGYIDEEFLDENEEIVFIDSEEEEKKKKEDEVKQLQPVSERK